MIALSNQNSRGIREMKMIRGAISGTLIGMGSGVVLAAVLQSVLPSLRAATSELAIFIATLMYGVGVFAGIMGALLAGMQQPTPVALAARAVERRAA
jgi:hypothetical protein